MGWRDRDWARTQTTTTHTRERVGEGPAPKPAPHARPRVVDDEDDEAFIIALPNAHDGAHRLVGPFESVEDAAATNNIRFLGCGAIVKLIGSW